VAAGAIITHGVATAGIDCSRSRNSRADLLHEERSVGARGSASHRSWTLSKAVNAPKGAFTALYDNFAVRLKPTRASRGENALTICGDTYLFPQFICS
jgi:hypothetical protein